MHACKSTAAWLHSCSKIQMEEKKKVLWDVGGEPDNLGPWKALKMGLSPTRLVGRELP
jgi:hypothetical protein